MGPLERNGYKNLNESMKKKFKNCLKKLIFSATQPRNAKDVKFLIGYDFLKIYLSYIWCHGSTAVAMKTVMPDDPGSNPGVNHECMHLSR
jgi:hypothetical protein